VVNVNKQLAKVDLFSINIQLYSQNHKLHFCAVLWGTTGNINAFSESFNVNFAAEYPENETFIRKTAKQRF